MYFCVSGVPSCPVRPEVKFLKEPLLNVCPPLYFIYYIILCIYIYIYQMSVPPLCLLSNIIFIKCPSPLLMFVFALLPYHPRSERAKGELRGKILMLEKITAWLQVRCTRSAHLTQPCCDFFLPFTVYIIPRPILEKGIKSWTVLNSA